MPRGRTACGGLGDLDRVDRDLVSARIVARVEIHLLTLAQSINAGALERGGMDEYILIAIVRPNEAEASLIVEEFHGSGIHGVCPLKLCIGHSAHAVRGHFPAHRFWKAGVERARPKRGDEAAHLSGQYRFKICGGEAQHLQGSNCRGGQVIPWGFPGMHRIRGRSRVHRSASSPIASLP